MFSFSWEHYKHTPCNWGHWSLTHWGRVTHISVGKLFIIGSDNGLSPGRRQAIICTNAGILLIWTLGTNFSEILSEIHAFSFTEMHLKMSSAKWRLFCSGLNVLMVKKVHSHIILLCFVWCVANTEDNHIIYILRPRQDGRHFPDDIFLCIFLNENEWLSIKILLKFVPKVPINNIPALVQIMAWRRPGDKPLSEPMMVVLPTHICGTRP